MSDKSPASPLPVEIEIPANLEAIYTNFALIIHSPAEVVLDFARIMPGMPKPKVCARLVMSPMNAKMLLRLLQDNLARYEAQYGQIVLPTNLADMLFRPPRPPSEG